jgi:hypothetical protein
VQVLMSIVEKELRLQQSLGEILSITQFEQMPMGQALKNESMQNEIPFFHKQLS